MGGQDSKVQKRVLFVVENITLAQVVRLATLAETLGERYDVHFASSEFDPLIFEHSAFSKHPVYTAPKADLFRAMEKGDRLYESKTLRRYVESELQLLSDVRPDLVVSDFRLSMSVSATKFGVPWATLINAYWSPYAKREAFPIPDHPIIKVLGEKMTARYFPKAMPAVFNRFAKPINDTRKHYGLPPIGSLLEVLTFADYTLYPDHPKLTPVEGTPTSHHFLGPVLWSPRIPMPDLSVLSEAEHLAGCPLVYATLGSSGRTDLLPELMAAVSDMPVRVLLAGAGRLPHVQVPDNVILCDFVPGDQAAALASAVICNGGSTTGYQALAAGKPLLLLPSNFDQFLASQAIEREGAGVIVKARNATRELIRDALTKVLRDTLYTRSAERIQGWFQEMPSDETFRSWVDSVLAPR